MKTSEYFLELFRNNLLDVGIDPVPYGTHSFRRGGVQWMSVGLRWPLRRICEWGGWSSEFSHMTIVKYLILILQTPGRASLTSNVPQPKDALLVAEHVTALKMIYIIVKFPTYCSYQCSY